MVISTRMISEFWFKRKGQGHDRLFLGLRFVCTIRGDLVFNQRKQRKMPKKEREKLKQKIRIIQGYERLHGKTFAFGINF